MADDRDQKREEVPAPPKQDADAIKNEVENAIKMIMNDPSKITSVVDQVKGNDETMRQVLNFINDHPEVKDKAAKSMMGNPPTMAEISRMPKEKRMELVQKSREARKQMNDVDPKEICAVIVTVSKVTKKIMISKHFPDGTKFSKGATDKIKEHKILYTYNTEPARLNKRVKDITGEKIQGDVVFYRQEKDGSAASLSLIEFDELFPKKKK